MARVTVEDCLENVENRFKLVLLAGKRARQLALGTEPLVEWENDKPTVVALREIAEGLVTEETMQASMDAEVAEENPFNEDDLAAALHAEISRELNQTDATTQATTTSPLQNLASAASSTGLSSLAEPNPVASNSSAPNTVESNPAEINKEPTANPFAMPETDSAASEPPAFGIPNQVPSEPSNESTEAPSFAPPSESNHAQENPFASSNVQPEHKDEAKSEPEPFNPFAKPSSDEGQDS